MGWVSALDDNGGTVWIIDAHLSRGNRFVVRADQILTALLEMESGIRICGEFHSGNCGAQRHGRVGRRLTD